MSYTGTYRNPTRRAEDVQENADVDLSREGDFVAVELENYPRTAVTGKVFEVNEDGFVICCNREWPLTRFLHLQGVRKAGYGYSNYQKVASHITLDDTLRLLPGMKSYLKNAYKDTNKQSSLICNNDLTA